MIPGLGMNPSALERRVKPGTTRRALQYAAPHMGLLLFFLVVVIVNAAIGIANPLIYR
jgi:hypothetical protein